jgi:hypothetical protein
MTKKSHFCIFFPNILYIALPLMMRTVISMSYSSMDCSSAVQHSTPYISHCELCSGKGQGGYAPLEQIASSASSCSNPSSSYSFSAGSSYAGNSDYSSHGSASGYSAGNSSSPNLEYAVFSSEISQKQNSEISHLSDKINSFSNSYNQNNNSKNNDIYFHGYLNSRNLNQSYASSSPFVLQNIETRFIGDVNEISEHIEDAFEKVTGESFPDDVIIHVCSKNKMKEFHSEFSSSWSDGIAGFSVNRKNSFQRSEIFVCRGELADVMATIGHELGHCISAPLDNMRDEEAKAFAFEFAWVKAIDKNNIAELKGCFNIRAPAKNNIHDRAFELVNNFIKNGADALSICFRLINKEITAKGDFL